MHQKYPDAISKKKYKNTGLIQQRRLEYCTSSCIGQRFEDIIIR